MGNKRNKKESRSKKDARKRSVREWWKQRQSKPDADAANNTIDGRIADQPPQAAKVERDAKSTKNINDTDGTASAIKYEEDPPSIDENGEVNSVLEVQMGSASDGTALVVIADLGRDPPAKRWEIQNKKAEEVLERYKKGACRLCLSTVDSLSAANLFDSRLADQPLSDLLMSIASINVYKGDGLSEYVCVKCFQSLGKLCDFRRKVEESNLTINHLRLGNVPKTLSNEESCLPTELQEESENEGNTQYSCSFCGRSFPREGGFIHHVQLQDCPPFYCKICCAPFYKNEELDSHFEATHGSYTRKKCQTDCGSCGAKFVHEDDLLIHNGKEHKKWICQHCGMITTTKSLLRVHYHRHVQISSLCEICGHVSSTADALSKHRKRHFKISSSKTTCEICGKLVSAHLLHNHARTHTKETPFECQFCHKKFNQFWNKIQHERIHTGELPYECSSCGSRFRYKCSLKTHLPKCGQIDGTK